jgi:hypothetical protein
VFTEPLCLNGLSTNSAQCCVRVVESSHVVIFHISCECRAHLLMWKIGVCPYNVWAIYHSSFPIYSNTQITPEKLEELKSRIPRAGPKYRLGMYFETIHDLSEFEDVHGPAEDGYSSYWETETEFESELGNFIFNNVTGDSASVICIDEAMDLLAMREQQQQMQMEMEEARRKATTSETVNDDLAKLSPGDLEEYTFNQPADDKRSGGASRHSHHSGSDGTYDGPQPAPIHTTHIVATPLPDEPDSKEDHIYETLDACQDHHFQVYITKGSGDSQRYSAATFVAGKATTITTGHAGDNDSDKSTSRKNGASAKSSSFKGVFSKSRHQSFEQATALPRKEKQLLKKRSSLDSHERGAQVAPKQYPGPIKGYGTDKPAPSSPLKRSSQEKINSFSPTGTNSSHNSIPQSLIIKHKGKTYVIPVVDRKRDAKSKQGNSSSSKRVHNVLCTTAQSNLPPPPPPLTSHPALPQAAASASFACCQSLAGPPVPPKKLATVSQTAPEHYDGGRRRKASQPNNASIAPSSKHSVAASNKVTHYGML